MTNLNQLKSLAFVFAIFISFVAFSQESPIIIKSRQDIPNHVISLKNLDQTNGALEYKNTISNSQINKQHSSLSSREINSEQLIFEDFSLFVTGTEDEPDLSLPLVGNDFYVNPDYTLQPGWSGAAVYPAGQTCAIMDATNGLLNTPEIEMSGTVTISFRIKLLPEETVDQTTIYCNLLTGGIYNPLPVDYAADIFTHEWTNVSFTFENTESDLCYVQFKAFRTHIIDDIVITREMDFIPAPNALEASDYTMEGFKTQWNDVYSADDYLLTVFRKIPTGTDSVLIVEGFDEINNDGTFIDESNPNYPEGWLINLDAGDTRQVITGDGNYISAPQSICMDAIGDTIAIANTGGRLRNVVINLKLVEYNGESGTIDFLVKRNGQWGSYAFMYLNGLYEYAGMDWMNIEVMWTPNKYEDFAMVYNSTGNAVVAFDDVTYKTGIPTENEYVLLDYPVEDTSFVTTELDPSYDYYYYVKAHNSEFTSVTSNWIKVFGLAPPNMLEASDITESSFQANWEAHPKADRYEIHNYDVYTLPSDEEDYVILSEDFSLVQNGGSPGSPVYDPDYTQHRLDEYTYNLDWFGTSTIYADGMIGAGYSENIWGRITTPEMTLNNSGSFHLKTSIYCTEGETVILASYSDRHDITFTTTGFQTIELDFETNENVDRERLRILTQHNFNFLIDYISITQDLSAGDQLYEMIAWADIDNGDEEHFVFDNLWLEENHHFAYDIYGIHNAFGDDYWSEISERINVDIQTDIQEISGNDFLIGPNPAHETLKIQGEGIKEIMLYNAYGQLILHSDNTEIDIHSYENGVYLVYVISQNGTSFSQKIVVAHP